MEVPFVDKNKFETVLFLLVSKLIYFITECGYEVCEYFFLFWNNAYDIWEPCHSGNQRIHSQ